MELDMRALISKETAVCSSSIGKLFITCKMDRSQNDDRTRLSDASWERYADTTLRVLLAS